MLSFRKLLVLVTLASAGLSTDCGRADPVLLSESPADLRVFAVETQVTTRGKLVTSEGAGKTRDLPLEATGTFRFRERRLPSAGRDALAFRAVREFQSANMRATIDGAATTLELPAASSLVVTAGRLDGMQHYSFRTLLTRDQVDLLDLPADPLALAAALPATEDDVDSEWQAPEWAAQLLAGVEAVETAKLTGQLLTHDSSQATIALRGVVQGLQEGAKTTVTIQGEATFDVAGQFVSAARLTYKIVAAIGAVAPGIDAEVTVVVSRRPSADAGRITDDLIAGIPLEAPPERLRLVFDAPPWRARLRHDRNWYVFHALLDQPPRVAILRLMEQGSLVCQCNISPIPDAAPGKTTPIEQYEEDIRMVLGQSFREVKSRSETPLADGRTRLEVVALGEVQVTGKEKEGKSVSLAIPMEWRYYLVADRSGRQMSFVFAVEQALVAQLGNRDRVLIDSLEFLP